MYTAFVSKKSNSTMFFDGVIAEVTTIDNN